MPVMVTKSGVSAVVTAARRRAQLPPPLFPAFRAAIALVVETEYDGGANDRERFVERMLARVLTQFPDPSNKINSSDIEFLLTKLQQIAA